MANSKGRGAADQTASAADDGAREGVGRATDTAGNDAGVASERTQQAVDEWTRGVQEGLARYQEMFSRLPGFGAMAPRGSAKPARSLASSWSSSTPSC